MNKSRQGHYDIAGFECIIDDESIRVSYQVDDPQHTTLCEKHAQGQKLRPKTCEHCGNIVEGIGVITWKDYPIEEVASPLEPEEPVFLNEEEVQDLMEKSIAQAWCKACIDELLAQAARGKVKVFDFATMDTDDE